MNPSNRPKLLGIIAIAVVALLAADRWVFTPLGKSWKARVAEIAQLRQRVDRGRRLLDLEKTARARWDGMRTNMLSSEPSVAETQLLKAFDRWSQDSRIGINGTKRQYKRSTDRNADDYATLEFRMDGLGSLSAVTRFLYDIEKDPLALKVDVVEITARDDSGEQLTLGVQVSGLLLDRQATP
jgi:hypothetical protein